MSDPCGIPFVLRDRRPLPDEIQPNEDVRFDNERQLWINTVSGRPLVLEFSSSQANQGPRASQFGETTITRTRESVDQSEITQASAFGETVVTRAQEGIDPIEQPPPRRSETSLEDVAWDRSVLERTKSGETTITATHEGIDQVEGTS